MSASGDSSSTSAAATFETDLECKQCIDQKQIDDVIDGDGDDDDDDYVVVL